MSELNHEDNLIILDKIISDKIYVIRGIRVMLDRDLAQLYGVTTGNLNKAVKRNLKRFPEDFMFQLIKQEYDNLIFHFGISSWGGTRQLPNVFTERGIAMLSGVLKSDRAIVVNIQIMRVFIAIRQTLLEAVNLKQEVELLKKKVKNHDKSIEIVLNYLDELIIQQEKSSLPPIGFKRDI